MSHLLRRVLPSREPADRCAEHGADLGREREIRREADHDAERDADRGSDGDGGSEAHRPSLRPSQQRGSCEEEGPPGRKEPPCAPIPARPGPRFAAVALLALLGCFVLDGVAAGVVSFVALVGVLIASIYALAGEDVQDGCGGIGGGTSF